MVSWVVYPARARVGAGLVVCGQNDGEAWKTSFMVNASPPWLLTVRELREALDTAHPDQVVTFSFSDDDLAALGATFPEGMRVVFAVKVDRASPDGPVFRLTSVGRSASADRARCVPDDTV
jgi:hypothetical protein